MAAKKKAIIGDIHANKEALEVVLFDITQRQGIPPKDIVCAGDIVGYGPDPNYCVERVRNLGIECVAGNHDVAVIDANYPLSVLNYFARKSTHWTREHLSRRNLRFLESLPLVRKTRDFILVHGCLVDDPKAATNEYDLVTAVSSFYYINAPATEKIENAIEPEVMFNMMDRPIAFTAHSHEARIIGNTRPPSGNDFEGKFYKIGTTKLIVNVGSVGQPRDEDPRAAYVIYYPDIGEFELRRLDYAIEVTANKIKKAGLPVKLANRLFKGK